jgi:hypothetical protein
MLDQSRNAIHPGQTVPPGHGLHHLRIAEPLDLLRAGRSAPVRNI